MEPTKRAPAFQLYPQDFISSLDVQMMSAAEVGAYCLLLFNSWTQPKQCHLPNDDAQLLFISKLTPEQWKQSKKKLLAKFPLTADKKYRYNPRLISEAENHKAFRERQSLNGKLGGRPRKDEAGTPAKAFSGETQNNPGLSQPLEVDNPTESSSTSSSTSSSPSSSPSEDTSSLRSEDAAIAAGQPEKKIEAVEPPTENPDASASHTRGAADVGTRKTRPHAYDPADIHPGLVLPFDTDTFRQLWAGYRQYREEQKLPRYSGGMMEQEALRTLSNLAAGNEATAHELIAQAIRKGWKDIYKLDEQRADRNPQQHAVVGGRGQKPTVDSTVLAGSLAERRWEQRHGGAGDSGPATGPYPGSGTPEPTGIRVIG